MIQKVEMYQAVCDRCGKKCQQVWATKESAFIDAFCRYWYKIDGKLYCPKLPLEKDFHKRKTLENVRISKPKRDKLGRYIIHKPPF